ncbi:MAG: branched-chain amino acid transport system substrate-binding protein [Actinomycetota bacterium]|nr:branched-chain amino acid transport system substrate-binding protein [Actinomycetota bacterium]
MTRNITRVVGAVLALFMAAACGVKPSAIHDRQARDWRTGQGIAAQFNHGPGDLTVEASAKDAGPDSATSKAPPAVESPLSGDGSVQVPAPPTPTASSPAGARSPHIASSAETPASGSPAPKEAAVMGPPAPSPAPQPDPGGPAPTPAPPREALTGEPDRTGVTDTTIRIGIHAPVTGAAPFPQKAFQDSNDLYWKFLAAKGGVHGRNVEVVFRDDQYNPTSAVQACREMVEKEKVFAIIGFAGADQITACARYAETAGVPYFSGGVNEDGLAGLNRYFAISQTYDQQSATLAKLMKNRIRKTKVAIVVISTPALNSTVRSITSEILKVGGLQIVRSSRIGKNGSDAELLSEAQQLKNAGAETVYVIASPITFIKLATNAQAQAYNPTWVGPGTTNGFAVVAEAGCPSIGDAKFLSPFPQLDAIDELDPDYKPAYRRYVGDRPDDIGILNWGMNKVVHQMLEATGRDLSRQSFLKTVTSGRVFHSNVYPDVSYDGTIRFGARTAHLLEADCTTRTWKTTGRFIAEF